MAAGDQALLDAPLRRSQVFFSVEHLLAGRDVVRLAGEQINRADDRLEVETTAEPDELTPWRSGSP
jgi:hypothetical protein